jgi:hypothetical protein
MTTATKITTDEVAAGEARLQTLIEDGADDDVIERAHVEFDAAKRRAADAERHGQERTARERDVARRRASAEVLRRKHAAAAAEASLRAGAMAPVLELRYAGIVVRVSPESVSDPVVRTTATEAFRRALTICQRDFENAVGGARAGAKGGTTAKPPMTAEKLSSELRDVTRHAIRHGTLTIVEATS